MLDVIEGFFQRIIIIICVVGQIIDVIIIYKIFWFFNKEGSDNGMNWLLCQKFEKINNFFFLFFVFENENVIIDDNK